MLGCSILSNMQVISSLNPITQFKSLISLHRSIIPRSVRYAKKIKTLNQIKKHFASSSAVCEGNDNARRHILLHFSKWKAVVVFYSSTILSIPTKPLKCSGFNTFRILINYLLCVMINVLKSSAKNQKDNTQNARLDHP